MLDWVVYVDRLDRHAPIGKRSLLEPSSAQGKDNPQSTIHNRMTETSDIRVAWLFPSLRKGNYWHPIFRDFSHRFETIVYTGLWSGFSPGLEETFTVEVVGKTDFSDYSGRFIYASPTIVNSLMKFRPQLVFASGFSIWTLLALISKPLTGARVAILYDGSSPSIDFRNSWGRLLLRRAIARMADGFCANSHAAADYLTTVLQAPAHRVSRFTYLVPDVTAMMQTDREPERRSSVTTDEAAIPIVTFLFVGELIPRKGLRQLLQACALLQQRQIENYRLLVIGDGEERAELEKLAVAERLTNVVTWLGWIPYGKLGDYFASADALIFPTLEDVWGMVLLEAMAFGRPVLCSKWAGSAELIVPGQNGEIFDPHQPGELAALMSHYLQQPSLLAPMGSAAQKSIALATPATAVDRFATMVERFVGNKPSV
jgi:glycosyltransferase involved in cell wall biosynthesis